MTAPTVAVGDAGSAAWADIVAGWGQWQTYNPGLTGAVTDPTLGSGSHRYGRWTQIGKLVLVDVLYIFGTSAVNQGSGAYAPQLPVTAANGFGASGDPNTEIGAGTILCNGLYTPVALTVAPTGGIAMRYIDAALNGGAHAVGSGAPGNWTANDMIRFWAAYQAA